MGLLTKFIIQHVIFKEKDRIKSRILDNINCKRLMHIKIGAFLEAVGENTKHAPVQQVYFKFFIE